MYIEYCNYNKYIDDYTKEIKNVFQAIANGIDGISLPIHMIREMREYLPSNLVVSAPVDYPCGLSSSKVRYHMALNSIKSGANTLDYVPNHYFLKHKFSELKKEIRTLLAICDDYKATLRVFLDYRRSTTNVLTIAEIINSTGVDLVFPTIGYHHDDYFDNIINAKMIEKHTDCSVIFNGYMWKKDQFDFAKECDIFGLRLYNLELLV